MRRLLDTTAIEEFKSNQLKFRQLETDYSAFTTADDWQERAQVLEDLVKTCNRILKAGKAAKYLSILLRIYLKHLGHEHLNTITTLEKLCDIKFPYPSNQNKWNFWPAIRHPYVAIAETYESNFGPGDPRTILATLKEFTHTNDIASLKSYYEKHSPSLSVEEHLQALAIVASAGSLDGYVPPGFLDLVTNLLHDLKTTFHRRLELTYRIAARYPIFFEQRRFVHSLYEDARQMTLSQFGEDHPWMCIWFCEMADYELEHGTYEQGAIYSSQAAEIWLKYDEKSRAANSFYTQGRMSKMAGNSLDAMQALSKAIHYGERDTRKYSVREIDKVIERPNGNRGVHLSSAPLDTHTAKEALTLLTQNLAEMPTDSKEDQKTHTNLTKLIEKLTPLVAPDGGESIYRARLKTAVKADDPASRLQSLKDLCTCLLAKDDHQAVSDLLYAEIARRAQPGDIEIHFETFHFQRNLLRRGIPQIAEATYKYTQRTLEKMRALSPKDPRYIRGLNQVIKELIAKRQLTYAYDLIEQVRRIAASLDGNHKEMDEVLGEFASYERFFTEASEH